MNESDLDSVSARPTGQQTVARGQRIAAETDIVSDSDQLTRIRFRRPIGHSLPVEGVPVAASQGREPGGKPISDVGALAESPSVREALPDDDTGTPEP